MRGLLLAAALALGAALGLGGCAGSGESQRSAGAFTDDAAITAKVKSAIATDVGARTAAAVNVDTYRGTVELTGFVDDRKTAERAAAAARKVTGVRAVKNSMRLKSST
jgi:osmotically-inducible protein OsmY